MENSRHNPVIGFRCPPELIEPLDRVAARHTRTRSNLIVHLIREALLSAGEIPRERNAS